MSILYLYSSKDLLLHDFFLAAIPSPISIAISNFSFQLSFNEKLILFTCIAAMLSAFFTLWIAIETSKSIKENNKTSKFAANLTMLSETEKLLQENPYLLELHGIKLDDLEKIKVSPKEFLYITSSLKASLAYYVLDREGDKSLSEYRKTFLSHEKVYKVYQLAKGNFISSTKLTEIIDSYYEEHPITEDKEEEEDPE